MALGHRVVAKKYKHNIATAAEDPVSPEVRCFMKAVGRYGICGHFLPTIAMCFRRRRYNAIVVIVSLNLAAV